MDISVYDGKQAQSLEDALTIQAQIDRDYQDGNSIHWGIAELKTNKMVGTCGYYRGLDQGAGELGCVLLPSFRGQGFMTAALQMAIDFGVNSIGLKRIWAVTTQQNSKAMKLLDRLHFVKVRDLQGSKIEYELIKMGL